MASKTWISTDRHTEGVTTNVPAIPMYRLYPGSGDSGSHTTGFLGRPMQFVCLLLITYFLWLLAILHVGEGSEFSPPKEYTHTIQSNAKQRKFDPSVNNLDTGYCPVSVLKSVLQGKGKISLTPPVSAEPFLNFFRVLLVTGSFVCCHSFSSSV